LLTPAHMFRMLNELIFVLLGGLMVWIGVTYHFFFDPRRPGWILLGALLIIWGARGWWRAPRVAVASLRAIARIRGASLILVGAVMISLDWLEFRWTGAALAVVGGILIVRGLASAALALRTA
jgi:multisubunit Na+/H+ antiporter MnhG subunit